uniref:Uncharacterized protein n=1 Tax=Panagrolaimus davidi TaxID=227884 RepID=A0A914QD35_9BILA
MNPAIEIICLGEFKSAEAEIIHDLCLKVLTNLTMIPTNYELIGKVIADFAEEKLKLAAKLIKMAIKNEPKIYCNPFKAFTDFKNPENFNIEEANWIAKKLSKIDNDEKEETHICNYQNWCKFYSESIPIKFESIAFRCHKMLQNEEFKKCHSNGFSCFLQNIKDFSNLENDLKRLLKDPSPNILNRAGYVYENVYILCFSKNVTENTVREFAKERREYCNKGKVDKNDMELLRIAYVGTCGFYGDDVVPRRLINHCENAMSVVGFEDISAKSAFIHAACTDILEQKYGNRKRENIDFSQSNNIDPSIEMICLGNFKKADAARLEFLCTVALNMVSLCHASLYHNSNLGDFIKDFDEKEQIEIAVKLIKYGLKHGTYDTGESSVKWYPVKSALFEYLEEILIEHPEDEKCDKVWDSWTTEEDDNDLPAKKRRDV